MTRQRNRTARERLVAQANERVVDAAAVLANTELLQGGAAERVGVAAKGLQEALRVADAVTPK